MFVSRCHSEVADDVNLFCSAVLHLNNSPVLGRFFKILHSVSCSLPLPRCICIHLKKCPRCRSDSCTSPADAKAGSRADVAQQSTASAATAPSRSAPRLCAPQHGVPWHPGATRVWHKGYLRKKPLTAAKAAFHTLRVPALQLVLASHPNIAQSSSGRVRPYRGGLPSSDTQNGKVLSN